MALRCLIVDDSEAFLASASALLSAQGLEVVAVASSGTEASRLVKQLDPDVVLLDVELGEEDGLEVARELNELVPAAHIVLISAHPRDELSEVIAETPAVGFLAKTALSAAAIAELVD